MVTNYSLNTYIIHEGETAWLKKQYTSYVLVTLAEAKWQRLGGRNI
jgi:hypothetical protein